MKNKPDLKVTSKLSIDTMHQANEFIALDDLFRAAAIYAEAIYELIK